MGWSVISGAYRDLCPALTHFRWHLLSLFWVRTGYRRHYAKGKKLHGATWEALIRMCVCKHLFLYVLGLHMQKALFLLYYPRYNSHIDVTPKIIFRSVFAVPLHNCLKLHLILLFDTCPNMIKLPNFWSKNITGFVTNWLYFTRFQKRVCTKLIPLTPFLRPIW